MKKNLLFPMMVLAFSGTHAQIDTAFLETVDFLRGERGIIVPAKQGAKKQIKNLGTAGALLGGAYGALWGSKNSSQFKKGYKFSECLPLPCISWKPNWSETPSTGFVYALPTAFGATVGSALGGTVGAVLGFIGGSIGGYPQRSFLCSRLNSTLRKYVSKDFEDLGQSQAALIYASYMRDTNKMSDVLNLPGNRDFLEIVGVREAVSKFYYGNAGPESLEKLSTMIEMAV